MKRIPLIVFAFYLCLLQIFGQTTPQETPLPGVANPQNLTVEQIRENDPRAFGGTSRVNTKYENEANLPEKWLPKSPSAYVRIEELRANKLSVSSEYEAKFNLLLENKKTKLARIVNVAANCYEGSMVSVSQTAGCENGLRVWGSGAFFSFRNDTNFNIQSKEFSDIELSQNYFVAGSGTVQGIISEIGEVPFENITFDSDAIQFLRSFTPSRKPVDFRRQKSEIRNGFSINNLYYSTSAAVKLNSTYVLRSIAYKQPSSKYIDNSGCDKRIDIYVAFKVVGIEKDGSVVLLWKELKSSSSPQFKTSFISDK